jgi:hypothetical protein
VFLVSGSYLVFCKSRSMIGPKKNECYCWLWPSFSTKKARRFRRLFRRLQYIKTPLMASKTSRHFCRKTGPLCHPRRTCLLSSYSSVDCREIIKDLRGLEDFWCCIMGLGEKFPKLVGSHARWITKTHSAGSSAAQAAVVKHTSDDGKHSRHCTYLLSRTGNNRRAGVFYIA